MFKLEPSLAQKGTENKPRPKKRVSRNRHRYNFLFFMGLTIYLLTRFIHLPDFPIYFFTDEAIQTQHAADLIANNFRGPNCT